MLTKTRALINSLRGRLLIAFGLLILLTVLLTGLLAAWMTNDSFSVLVTEEGKAQAYHVAPMLEASYLLHGNWTKIDKLRYQDAAIAAQTTVSNTVNGQWYSDVDWLRVTATTLNLPYEFFVAESNASDSTAEVITQYGKSLDEVVNEIMAAEKQAIATAVTSGTLTSTAAEKQLKLLPDQINSTLAGYTYLVSAVNWNEITADQLGLTKMALRQALTQKTIAELAQARGIQTQQIARAILDQEVATLRERQGFSEEDNIWTLSSSFWWLDEYLGQPAADDAAATTTAPEWLGPLASFLQGGERLLLADSAGILQYDSAGELSQGIQLAREDVAKGVPLYRRPTTERIGTLVIAPNPDYYSSHQRRFLRNVTYSLLASGALAVLLALIAAFLFARQIIAPVTALTCAAQQVADGDTDARLPVTNQNELGQMSATFNQMAEALATQRTLRQRLVNDISHELNTPLSVIQLEMQALRDGLQTPAQAFEQVQGEINLLRNLVRDLSNLETTDNGHFPLQCEPVDLLTLAQQAVKRWQAKAESKGVTLTLTTPVDLLPITEADPARLTQVLGNLLDNALRHTESGGAITVDCQAATLAALALPPAYRPVKIPPALGLVVMVRDTGCGIPAADLPHLFERFYRVDSSRNRRSGGRGLGLAIVRQIMVAHGGHVWAQSIEGEGSRFGFWLPIIESE